MSWPGTQEPGLSVSTLTSLWLQAAWEGTSRCDFLLPVDNYSHGGQLYPLGHPQKTLTVSHGDAPGQEDSADIHESFHCSVTRYMSFALLGRNALPRNITQLLHLET